MCKIDIIVYSASVKCGGGQDSGGLGRGGEEGKKKGREKRRRGKKKLGGERGNG
jgi:hypothetical protein